ncbi:MAG: hypothetical protein RIB84_00485 [Sneathiellaceae bacterium]
MSDAMDRHRNGKGFDVMHSITGLAAVLLLAVALCGCKTTVDDPTGSFNRFTFLDQNGP